MKSMFKNKYLSRFDLWSLCLGNFFEHYDTALFSFLAPILAPLIFPKKELISALILTYAMIPFGMIVRPIGALLFGYIADRFGRREALFWSLGGMSIVSGCIAFCPLYARVGILAPIIFCLARVLQNLLASGETMGGALFLLENSPKDHHDFLSSVYSMSTIGGILLASFGVSIISLNCYIDWGWRLLYLIGCLTGLFGFVLRRKIHSRSTFGKTPNPIKALWVYRKPLFIIAIASGFSYANYSVALILMNGFVPLVSTISKNQMISLNTALLVLDFCALPLFGYIASKISREKMMLGAALTILFLATPLFRILPGVSLNGMIAIRVFLVLAGVAFCAPFHAWAIELVPKEHRYGIILFGYAIGCQLLGGPTVALSLWIFKSTGIVTSVIWYWSILALICSILLASRCLKKEVNYEKE